MQRSAIFAGVFVFSHKKPAAAVSLSPVLVKFSPVEVTDMPLTATVTGTLIANNHTDISPKVAGYVTKIAFTPDTFVKTGSVLIQYPVRQSKTTRRRSGCTGRFRIQSVAISTRFQSSKTRFNSESHALQ